MNVKDAVHSLAQDLTLGITLKSIVAGLASALAYFIGADFEGVFTALIALVGIEFVLSFLSDLRKCKQRCEKKWLWMPVLSMLERVFFMSAVQVVTYTLFVAAAHLSEGIVFGNSFTLIEESVISFLALTQLARVFRLVGQIGFAVPQNVLDAVDTLSSLNNKR